MKKLVFGLIATIMLSSVSFGQTELKVNNLVANEEYKSSDSSDQRLFDYLNAASASLQALEMNSKDFSNYEAVVHFNNDEKAALSNSIVVSSIESAAKASHGSCQVCGLSSAYSCVKKIKAAFAGQDDFDIHVHNDGGGCATLSW